MTLVDELEKPLVDRTPDLMTAELHPLAHPPGESGVHLVGGETGRGGERDQTLGADALELVEWNRLTDRDQGSRIKKTPNLDRLYGIGDELGVDAVLMWHYRTISDASYSDYPVEIYAIDVEKQRVYVHEGQSTEVEALVRQALDDFVAGRES